MLLPLAPSRVRDELISYFNAVLQERDAEAKALRDQVTLLSTVPTKPSPSKPKLPDVAKLDRPTTYDVWLLEMQGKLRVNSEPIGDDCTRTYYIYSRLEPKVKDLVVQQIRYAERTGDWSSAPNVVLQALDHIYDDPNKILFAEARLKKMKMKDDDSFRQFLANWVRARCIKPVARTI
ncbi:hypothetical protein DL766_006699 [Monosporascus sp. MC13-8B]|uniref:Uncharacterized protein n=1 Tax=Monosporascus cannonballus TaxID=155416 RepID=A0ABY0H1T9_9PEZI|nr:hypothetical protein DL762_008032 [Monosporascus cannonballus]RYO84480.1 hypothetical protein DL763_007465 [Monosporascus cannonballus]RYP26514.1 hypothetical protein DL766_006699 [Monosporascus sp. MC13-8B]